MRSKVIILFFLLVLTKKSSSQNWQLLEEVTVFASSCSGCLPGVTVYAVQGMSYWEIQNIINQINYYTTNNPNNNSGYGCDNNGGTIDMCGVCRAVGETPCTPDAQPVDCNNVQGGSAVWTQECGCIGGNTGITACACDLVINSISISISTATCKPGESVILSTAISKTGTGAANTIFEWEAYSGGQWRYLEDGGGDLDAGTCNNFTYPTRILGTVLFRLKIVYDCNGVTKPATYSNSVELQSKYCVADFSSSYSSNMNTAWASTISSHTSNPTLKYEFGFSVDFQGSSLTFVTNNFNASGSCEASVVGNGYISVEANANNNLPKFGGTWTVGAFHTHPTVTNCPSSVCYDPGPSAIDNTNAAESPKYPRVVRTYSSTVCGGHSSTLPYHDYAFSAGCTTY